MGKNLKETVVIYLIEENDQYNIYMINTMAGNIDKIFTSKNLDEVDKFNDIFLVNKENIINGEGLELIKRYILKLDSN